MIAQLSVFWRSRPMTNHAIARTLRLAAAALVAGSAWAPVSAESYPERPIKLVSASAIGSTPDVLARLIADGLSPRLGQPVVVDNRPGAGQSIAIKSVATADPDGYTLMIGNTGSLAINPVLYRNFDFSANRALAPVALLATTPNLLALSSTMPPMTAGEVVAYAKTHPGQLSFGASLGTPPHLLGEFFRAKTKTEIVYVPYKGGSQTLPDLLSGRIQLGADAPALLMPYLRSGKLHPLVVTSTSRLPELPDVPTLTEIGIDGYPPQTWMGIVAPVGVPAVIVGRLNAVINDLLRSEDIQARLAQLGFAAHSGSPQDFAAVIANDAANWAAVVRLTGVHGD
jgi:tripartite-type tricarboxylate transporter receptor subunit TctC